MQTQKGNSNVDAFYLSLYFVRPPMITTYKQVNAADISPSTTFNIINRLFPAEWIVFIAFFLCIFLLAILSRSFLLAILSRSSHAAYICERMKLPTAKAMLCMRNSTPLALPNVPEFGHSMPSPQRKCNLQNAICKCQIETEQPIALHYRRPHFDRTLDGRHATNVKRGRR